MELNTDILISLIKEEINTLLKEESVDEAAEGLYGYLSTLMGKLNLSNPSQLDNIYQQAKQKLTAQQPGNRKDVREEGCGDMQSIDMNVDSTHDKEDHEGSMAKRQMFKTAQYAADIFDMIEDGEEFPAWIQSKMTKIADYIGAVKHYLEYDEVMGERKLTKAEKEKREEIAKAMEEEDPDIDMSKKMAIATAQAKKSS